VTERVDRIQDRHRRYVRLALADHREANELIEGAFLDDDTYDVAVEAALADWNGTPPRLGNVTLDTHPNRFLLYKKVAIDLLRTEVIRRIRNAVDIGDGGAQINHTGKAQLLSGVADALEREYEEKKKALKREINLGGAWGGVPSEYEYSGVY
jgi:hypothetical protein